MKARTLIEKVLKGEEKPLSVLDIWNIAKEEKYAKSYGSGIDGQKKAQINSELNRWYKEKDSTIGRYEKGKNGNKYITYFLRKPATPVIPSGGGIEGTEDSRGTNRVITPKHTLFKIPEKSIGKDCVSVMMPFAMEFNHVHETIKGACSNINMQCYRVDDLWNNSTIIQEIFELIYRSSIVIVDFTGKNSNVFYEVGIAHTLDKNVIPITQNMDDIPFDLRHHKVLKYLNNNEGLQELKKK